MSQFDRFYREVAEEFTYPASPEEAIALMTEGNRRFVEVREQLSQPGAGNVVCTCQAGFIGESVAPSGEVETQAPFGVILGCSDARVPSELIFDAVQSFPDTLKLVTVLGHTGCGAVNAAVATYLSPKTHANIAFSRSLRVVVNHILVAVRSAALSLEQVYGNDMLRYKGVLSMANNQNRVVFQGVHMLMGGDLGKPWGADEKRESKMVFIGRNLPEDLFVKGLEQCLADPA